MAVNISNRSPTHPKSASNAIGVKAAAWAKRSYAKPVKHTSGATTMASLGVAIRWEIRCAKLVSKHPKVGRERAMSGLEVVKTQTSLGIVGHCPLEKVGFLVVKFGKIIDPFDRIGDMVEWF